MFLTSVPDRSNVNTEPAILDVTAIVEEGLVIFMLAFTVIFPVTLLATRLPDIVTLDPTNISPPTPTFDPTINWLLIVALPG
uniref:Uncharacterized protein n=1 Tax=viral metagenome TaxID=1070528 RepID=A0A6C0I8S1_9ZZZZ